MEHSGWTLSATRALGAGAALAAFSFQAQAAVAVSPAYVPGTAMVEAGSFGGAAVVVWASVLLVTLACLAAMAFLLHEPAPVAVGDVVAAQPAEVRPARRQAQAASPARSPRRLPKRRATKAARPLPALRPAFSAKASGWFWDFRA